MSSKVIRPELPGTERRMIEVGQIWSVDGESAEWFVLAPHRVIALFAGGADHTPQSLVFTYGDRLCLKQTATVYADLLESGRHAFVTSNARDENYIALCSSCGEGPLAQAHHDPRTNALLT